MSAALKDKVQSLLGVSHSSNADTPLAEPSSEELQQTKEKYEKAGQGQVFSFWDSLDSSEKAKLFGQLRNFDPAHINTLFEKVHAKTEDAGPATLEPLPASATSSVLDSQASDLQKWYDAGLEYVAHNKVGVVLMAGGQGTRLGSSAPKGCYDIGLPSKKSLFQLQAERIFKVQQLAAKKHGKTDVVVPWYVMTSGPTRGPTEQFFKENKYFGLEAENVFIFEQGVLPCISNEGKILLEGKSKVCLAFMSKGNFLANINPGCCCP